MNRLRSSFPPDATLPDRVQLVEVGLRDGLQNADVLSTDRKLELLRGLVDAGLRTIQVASFVHPKRVPQMADAEALCGELHTVSGAEKVRFSGLALNLRGVERLAAAGLEHVDLSLSASEPHSLRNSGMTVLEAETHLLGSIVEARRLGLHIRVGVQCAFGWSDDDLVPVERVTNLAQRLVAAGAEELAIADSAGLADPLSMARLLVEMRATVGDLPITLHLHDTRGLGLANLLTALRFGISSFDTAFGGLGGCPFIPGATGNVATEDVVNMLSAMGIATGVDIDAVVNVSAKAAGWLDVELPSKIFNLRRATAPVPVPQDPSMQDSSLQDSAPQDPVLRDLGA